jgi:hypothetical protein
MILSGNKDHFLKQYCQLIIVLEKYILFEVRNEFLNII